MRVLGSCSTYLAPLGMLNNGQGTGAPYCTISASHPLGTIVQHETSVHLKKFLRFANSFKRRQSPVRSLQPKKIIMKGTYLFRHIIHRALLLDNEKNYADNNFFLSDILYLSMFLENLVIQPSLTVKEFPELKIVDSPYKIDFYEQYDLRDKTFIPYYFDDEEDDFFERSKFSFEMSNEYFLKERIRESDLFKELIGIQGLNFVVPQVRMEHKRVYELGKRLEDEKGDFDVYMAMSLNELEFAQEKDYLIVPDKSHEAQKALNYTKYRNPRITDEMINSYNSMSKSAIKDLLRLLQREKSISKQIKLPPVTSIALNESNSPTDLIKIALQMRTAFSDLRMAFQNYEEKVRNDSLTLAQRLDALNELEYFTSEISKQYPQQSRLNISDLSDFSNFGRLADGAMSATDGSSIAGTLMKKTFKISNQKS